LDIQTQDEFSEVALELQTHWGAEL